MTPEIFRVVDFTTEPRTDIFQVQTAGKIIACFDTSPEAKAFVRGFEAGEEHLRAHATEGTDR